MGANAILIVTGGGCLALAFTAMRKLMPKEGKPASAWIRTDTRASAVTMLLLVTMLAGMTLLLKGVFGG